MVKFKQRRPRDPESSEAYSHLQSRGSRDLGRTRDGERHEIPSSTYRTLESVIPASSLRTRERYDYNPRTGKGRMVEEQMDVLTNARERINSLRIPVVTDRNRQRHEQQKGLDADPHDRLGYGPPPSPVPTTVDKKRTRRY